MTDEKSSKQSHEDNICGAKTRDGDPCKNPAGFKTDHVGEGRCHLHGGTNTGAPEGNQNARKHGAYEKVIRSQLDDSEKEVFDSVDDSANLVNELRTLRYKLVRLLNPPEKEIYDEDIHQKVQLDISETEKAKGIAIIASEIRKIAKEMKGDQGKGEDKLRDVVSAIEGEANRILQQETSGSDQAGE